MEKSIIKKTLSVPAINSLNNGNNAELARQLDIALLSVGFKMSVNLFLHISTLHPSEVNERAKIILEAARELIGDHVDHNTYFIDFPNNIPDSHEFWLKCIAEALVDPVAGSGIALQLSTGIVSLLDLPSYGNYQYSYEEMVAVHEQFVSSTKDRITILHLGKTLPEVSLDLYTSLAESTVPLNDTDQSLLRELAICCLGDVQPVIIPIREHKAIINQVRLVFDKPLLVDNVTDILRLACAISNGDVGLLEKTKFTSFPRKTRRILLQSLNRVVKRNPEKLADVNKYSERWKRLGEKLHAGEYKKLKYALDVFAVARGDKKVRTLAGKVELAFLRGNTLEAIELLANNPGLLFRSMDRILVHCSGVTFGDLLHLETLFETVETVIRKVSGRVILSVREHLMNRINGQIPNRVFVNRKGTAWTKPEVRDELNPVFINRLFEIFDAELISRIPLSEKLVVDPQVFDLGLPTSEKTKSNGFGILPRGSKVPAPNDILRFFIYWKQQKEVTDYDLSAVMLDENFHKLAHISYTSLRADGYGTHSGDITNAPNGASEFIDLDLRLVNPACRYIIPQVHMFSGESFIDAEECFFGYMKRTPEQMGKPFEASSVKVKSDLCGSSNVALPLVFIKDEFGNWSAQWLHLFINGFSTFNRVEEHMDTISALTQSMIERKYLKIDYLTKLFEARADTIVKYDTSCEFDKPITFIGLEKPENLPEGSKTYTLNNLHELIPT